MVAWKIPSRKALETTGKYALKFKVNELEAQILEMRVRHDEHSRRRIRR